MLTREFRSDMPNSKWCVGDKQYILDETTEEGKLMVQTYVSNFPHIDFTLDGDFITSIVVLEKPNEPLSEIEELKQENKLLKAQVQANSDISDFHEELIVEMAMMLYQ